MGKRSGSEGLAVAVILQDTVQRYGIEAMIRSFDRTESVCSFASCEESGVLRDGGRRFDIAVLASQDARAGRTKEEAEAVRASGVRLLVLVDGSDDMDIARASGMCGDGFVDRSDLTPQTLSEAVADVVAGKLYVSSALARTLLLRAGRNSVVPVQQKSGIHLTPRELQILELLAEGLSNKQVARRLQISEHGVKRLVGNVLAKLNCPNRTMAVVRALEEGLLTAA